MESDYKREEFKEIFDCTYAEFIGRYDGIWYLGEDPKANAFTRRYAEKYSVDFLHPTREEVLAYYMSDEYAYLLIQRGNQLEREKEEPLKQFEIEMALYLFQRFADSYKNFKVLNYGCGSSLHAFALKEFGFEVTLADIPHKFFRFFKKVNSNFKFHDITSDASLTEEYNYIICREVLEHVLEPEQILEHLVAHLKPQGYIFLSTFFDDMNGQDPSHLRKNKERYQHDSIWYPIVESKGLKIVLYNDGGTPKIFRKQ